MHGHDATLWICPLLPHLRLGYVLGFKTQTQTHNTLISNLICLFVCLFSGQLARSLHGAVRKTGYSAVPEKLGVVRTFSFLATTYSYFLTRLPSCLVSYSISTTLGTTTPRDTFNVMLFLAESLTDRLPSPTLRLVSTRRVIQSHDRATLLLARGRQTVSCVDATR